MIKIVTNASTCKTVITTANKDHYAEKLSESDFLMINRKVPQHEFQYDRGNVLNVLCIRKNQFAFVN